VPSEVSDADCDDVSVLADQVAQVAAFYRAHGEERTAAWLESRLDGDPAELPARVLEMFKHGMGGLYDAALHTGGVQDLVAERQRDALLEELNAFAKSEMR
jgi:hypothetical protein